MRVLVVVPKWDELRAVAWGLNAPLERLRPQTLRSNARYYSISLEVSTGLAIEVAVVFMDSQNNVNSAVVTTEAITTVRPNAAIMVGTALGNPKRARIGSVYIASSVEDVVERRYSEGKSNLKLVATPSSTLLLDLARQVAVRVGRRNVHDWCFQAAADLNLMHEAQVEEFVDANRPSISDESIASGNDYFMDKADPATAVWTTTPHSAAYDMESAGFSRACKGLDVPWLVIRGVSDFGTPETKSPAQRSLATAVAGRTVLRIIEALPDRLLETDGYGPSAGVFQTLDDLSPLGDLLDAASSLDVLSRTSVNLLGNYSQHIRRLLDRGGRVRLLMVDPHSKIAGYLYGENSTAYLTNVATTKTLVDGLRRNTIGELSVRWMDAFPPFSLTILTGDTWALARIQLNLLHERIGRDRPVVDLQGDDEWYNVFVKEFETSWNNL